MPIFDLKNLCEEIIKIEHGFNHIIETGQVILKESHLNHFELAQSFIESRQPYQIRMLGTYLLGELSVSEKDALKILENKVSKDENWRVQEMLAKAFDKYCQMKDYKNALPKIKFWIENENINIQRAVTEGLRIWTSRNFFKQNPEIAISLISQNRNTESIYLRKSIGNSLRDINKKFPEEIKEEISKWNVKDKKIEFIVKLIYR